MKTLTVATLLTCILIVPALAAAETHEVDLLEFASDIFAGPIEFDTDAAMTGITSVSLHLRGTSVPSTWACIPYPAYGIGAGEDAVFAVIKDGETNVAHMLYDLALSFDGNAVFSMYATQNWSSLNDRSGVIDLNHSTNEPSEVVDMGSSCNWMSDGSIIIEAAFLRFEAASIVADETSSWSAVKASYR